MNPPGTITVDRTDVGVALKLARLILTLRGDEADALARLQAACDDYDYSEVF